MEGMGKPPGIHLTDYTSSHTIIGLAIISFNGCCAQEGSAMKPIAFAVVVLACCLAWAGCMSGRYTQYPGERAPGPDSLALMTKQDVISMSKAGAGDDVIIDMIKKSGSAFQMRARDVVELADSGVSNRVLRTMIKTTDQESSGEEAGGYYAYPPYWYAGYPFTLRGISAIPSGTILPSTTAGGSSLHATGVLDGAAFTEGTDLMEGPGSPEAADLAECDPGEGTADS